MSFQGPLGPFGPFGGGPFEDLMRDLARLLTTQGPVNWEVAGQLAPWIASGGQTEPNPDPLSRVRLEELLRVAELQVAEATGLRVTSGRGVLTARAVTKADWARLTLLAWRPLLERLATAFKAGLPDPSSLDPDDQMAQALGALPQMLGPLLLGMQAGTMAGHLGSRAMGTYDLPLPRPPSDELLFVPANIDAFAAEWN
ncbi:MAG: zinc-dependent metalloprotease, partial [Acidimicrobiales bacterium]